MDKVLCNKNPTDTQHKEPISVKNLYQGYTSWSSQNIVLEWALDTDKQILILPTHRVE